jgi:hypothetical protein
LKSLDEDDSTQDLTVDGQCHSQSSPRKSNVSSSTTP